MKQILAILASAVLLTACGIKGDLYLPQELDAPQESVSDIEADPLNVPQQ
jgi:predicted small lipoprotein YifL